MGLRKRAVKQLHRKGPEQSSFEITREQDELIVLARLAELRDRGHITAGEFETRKRLILDL